MRVSRAILLLAILVPAAGFAANGYKCKPRQILSLGSDGMLTEDNYAKLLIGVSKEFVVDRATGRMLGSKGFSNQNAFGSPQVLDRGSAEQSFKVLTVYEPNVSVAYLEVREFADGKEKPFLFIGSGTIVSGTCVHF